MAHECPECGVVCRCNGDIDDCVLNFEDNVIRCNHYLKPECAGWLLSLDEEEWQSDMAANDTPELLG